MPFRNRKIYFRGYFLFSIVTMGYLTNVYRDSHQKELKKKTEKSPKPHLNMMSRSPGKIELTVACDVIESVELSKIYGFYEVISHFEPDFRVIG